MTDTRTPIVGLLDRFFGPPKPERFAAALMDALKRSGDPREANFVAEDFRIDFTEEGENAGTTNLRNLYAEHCSVPRAQRKQHLRHLVRSLLSANKQMPEEFGDARPDILPVVRSKSYLELARLQGRIHEGEPPDWPHEEIGDHLAASLVYDLPESMRSINAGDLDDWGVTFYEAMEAARQNLHEIEFACAAVGESLYAMATGDNYDASRLLLLDFVRQREVQGEHVAMVPNRDTLLITGSEDALGLKMMTDLAEKALDEPRPMCGIPLMLVGDVWETWTVPGGHPLRPRFDLLEAKTMHGEYTDQKSLLDALHEKNGIDVFVASYNALQSEDGDVLSYAVWSAGVPTLLPRTKKLVFFREGQEVVAGGDWEHVASIVGNIMEPLDEYPPRWRVYEFPTDEQLRAIGMPDW